MQHFGWWKVWTLTVWSLLVGLAAPVALAQPAVSLGRGQVLVETGWLAANLTRPDVRVVDVSTTREVYDRGHIAGAVYLSIWTDLADPTHPVRGMAPTREQFQAVMRRVGIRNTDAVILYDDVRSLNAARAFWIFKLYRHDRVAILNGGSGKWVAEGRALVTETRAVTPSAYVAGQRDESIVARADDVLAALERAFILDARSPREYAGLDVRSARGGRIPGAVNVEWVLAVNPDGTFKSVEELRALYARAGLTSKDRKAVLYCQTGVRAAHTWFVLRYLLGFPNVRNYDGSWEEWGNRTDVPIGR
jgi:thiosulfate/3-mercaptopyruvate sulfurtransferase